MRALTTIAVALLMMAGMFALTITLAVALDKPQAPEPVRYERVIWV